MSKSKSHPFFSSLKSMDRPKVFFALSLFVFTMSYPGSNFLQSQVLTPGPIKKYTIPTPSLSPYPVWDNIQPPPVTATSYLIQDVESKTIIASRREDVRLPPASITKLMTALVALDTWDDPDTKLTVKTTNQVIGQTIDLLPGETLTINSLLQGLLIHSGNDAALVIADNYPGGYDEFVKAMNNKAQSLHLVSTTYKNPSGIDEYGHVTTARDIATLAAVALTDPRIQKIVQTPVTTITDTTNSLSHKLESTDELLSDLPGLIGGKTGYTSGAGECFVSYVDRGGHQIITVVLGASDRFGDTRKLVEWTYAHHTWMDIDAP